MKKNKKIDFGCQCVCHSFPDHSKLQDALDANKWHIEQLSEKKKEVEKLKEQLRLCNIDQLNYEAKLNSIIKEEIINTLAKIDDLKSGERLEDYWERIADAIEILKNK